jgi:hypothetical protein
MDKYKLTKKEKDKIDECWIFIDLFITTAKNSKSVQEFRKEIIKSITKKYTVEEFYFFEKILNKLVYALLYKYKIKYNKIESLKDIFINIKCDRSFANKMLLYDEKNKNLIFTENYMEILNQPISKLLNCFNNRELYDILIKKNDNKKIEDKLPKIETYYPYDYGLPNVNLFFYNENNKKTWIKNIKHMYYSKNAEENWYINLYEKQILKCLDTK